MTAQTVETAASTAATTIIVDKGAEFARILSNVLPSADKDQSLPILATVNVKVTADRITVAATDRYTLSVDYITREKDSPAWLEVEINLARGDVERIVKMMKSYKIPTVPLTIELGEHGKFTASTWDASIGSQLVDGQFPAYEKLFPTDIPEDRPGWPFAGFNAANFARFAKIVTEARLKPTGYVRLTFWGDEANRKPVLVEVGRTFRGLVTPVRLS